MIGRATEFFILATIVIWIVWDFYADLAEGPQATESETIRRWSKHPIVPLVVGVLLGHLFWCGT